MSLKKPFNFTKKKKYVCELTSAWNINLLSYSFAVFTIILVLGAWIYVNKLSFVILLISHSVILI